MGVMRAREYGLFVNKTPIPEPLQLLASFCKTGTKPTAADSTYTSTQQDAWVKELLGYRVLDVMAQVYGKGVEEGNKDKSLTPLNPKLVRGYTSRRLVQCVDTYLLEPTTSGRLAKSHLPGCCCTITNQPIFYYQRYLARCGGS